MGVERSQWFTNRNDAFTNECMQVNPELVLFPDPSPTSQESDICGTLFSMQLHAP